MLAMPRQKQDRPKRTKCSAIEANCEPGQQQSVNNEVINSADSQSSTSSSSSSSASSSRTSSPQPATKETSGPATINNSEQHQIKEDTDQVDQKNQKKQKQSTSSSENFKLDEHENDVTNDDKEDIKVKKIPSQLSPSSVANNDSNNKLTKEEINKPKSPKLEKIIENQVKSFKQTNIIINDATDTNNNINNNKTYNYNDCEKSNKVNNIIDNLQNSSLSCNETDSSLVNSLNNWKRKVSTTDSMMVAATTVASSSSPPPPTTSPCPLPPPPPPPPLPSSAIAGGVIKSTLAESLNSLFLNPGSIAASLPPPPPPPSSSSSSSSSSHGLPNGLTSGSQSQQPIYIAISTNPLILVPLSYNPETGGLNPSIPNPSSSPSSASLAAASSNLIKLPSDPLLTSQLNGLLVQGLDKVSLLGNTLEAHRSSTRNCATLLNGLLDPANQITVNSVSTNHNSNLSGHLVTALSGSSSTSAVPASFSSPPPVVSCEAPLDLSSNQSNDQHSFSHHQPYHHHSSSTKISSRHRESNRLSLASSASATSSVCLVKKEAEATSVDDDSSSPLNLYNNRNLPQSTSAVAAAGATGGSTSSSSTTTATSFTPEAVFKQSSYHCEHCHIGFYKKENYVIHKRHYCSARRSQTAAAASASSAPNNNNNRSSPDFVESDGSPNSSPEISLDSDKGHSLPPPASVIAESGRSGSRRVSVASRSNVSGSSGSPASSPPHQPLSQYYCVACGIRFTSLDNLHAHQTYYCLKRNSINPSAVDKLNYIVSIPGGTGSEVSCVKCKATYCNEEAFLSHVCSAMSLSAIAAAGVVASASQNGSKAMQQAAVAAAAAAAVAAAEAASASSSPGHSSCDSNQKQQQQSQQQCFRCTICGYKGQTLQGMRIHVRMHSQCFRCTICGYKGHTLRGMRTHVRIHQDKIQGLPEESFIACFEDEALVAKNQRNGPTGPKRRRRSLEVYGGGNGNNLAASYSLNENKPLMGLTSGDNGGQLAAAFGLTTPASTTTTTTRASPSAATNDICNINSSHSEISSENEDEAASVISENELSGRDDSRQGGGSGESLHSCQFCYYTSTYKGNVVRHIKLVHKDVSGSNRNGPSPLAPYRREEEDSIGGHGGYSVAGDSLNSNDVPLDLKSTNKRSSNNNNNTNSNNNQRTSSPNNLNSPPNGARDANFLSTSSASSQAKKAVPKYCRSCDISFQFLTSFIAHKKYYCSSHSNETNSLPTLPESKSPV